MDERPVLVGFDGSDAARHAVREAVALLPGRPVIVLTVWEPGLAQLPISSPTGDDLAIALPSPETVLAVDEAQRARAAGLAEEGAQLARSLGADARATVSADEARVADTLADAAREHDAAAIVVGTHGHGRLADVLVGSTAQRLVRHADRPVLVVHGS